MSKKSLERAAPSASGPKRPREDVSLSLCPFAKKGAPGRGGQETAVAREGGRAGVEGREPPLEANLDLELSTDMTSWWR